MMSDGMTAVWQPKCSFLERADANGQSALITASVPNYNGMDWRRSVLHRQGRYTLFVDTLASRETSGRTTVELNFALAGNANAPSVSRRDAPPSEWSAAAPRTSLYEFNAPRCPTGRGQVEPRKARGAR